MLIIANGAIHSRELVSGGARIKNINLFKAFFEENE